MVLLYSAGVSAKAAVLARPVAAAALWPVAALGVSATNANTVNNAATGRFLIPPLV